MTPADLSDCQCPSCKASALRYESGISIDPIRVYYRAVLCDGCGEGYDVVWGVPFFGIYEEADFLSLIEIAANADNYRRGGEPARAGDLSYAQWYELLEGYHLSPDRKAFLSAQGVPPAAAGWLPNRYGEHVLFRGITRALDLAGKRVLDVGAGTGFDSFKLVRAGAQVTALEFSPVLAHEGRSQVPQARWIGGSSRVMPFANGAFDVAIANAALHHMRDIPTVISEMLRVLKPDGYLLTLCDSYRHDDADEGFEIDVFAHDPAVLMGVNEGIPRLDEFLSTLMLHRDQLELRIFTSSVHGVQRRSVIGRLNLPKIGKVDLMYPREWPLEEALAMLRTTSGAIALSARLKAPVKVDQPRWGRVIIRPADFAESLDSQSTGIAHLARRVPRQFVDLPLLDSTNPKFRLLNGWKRPVPGEPYRTAVGRARLFLTRPESASALRLGVLAPHIDKGDKPEIILSIDGCEVARRTLVRGLWTELVGLATGFEAGVPLAVEARIVTSSADQEARMFHIRELAFSLERTVKPPAETDLKFYGLEALAELGLLGTGRTRLLLSTDHALGVETLNRLRMLGLRADVVVAEGQESFFSCEPEVAVIGLYPDPVLDPARLGALPEDIRLIVAPDSATAKTLSSMLPKVGGPVRRFVILSGGHGIELGVGPVAGQEPPVGRSKAGTISARARHALRRLRKLARL